MNCIACYQKTHILTTASSYVADLALSIQFPAGGTLYCGRAQISHVHELLYCTTILQINCQVPIRCKLRRKLPNSDVAIKYAQNHLSYAMMGRDREYLAVDDICRAPLPRRDMWVNLTYITTTASSTVLLVNYGY